MDECAALEMRYPDYRDQRFESSTLRTRRENSPFPASYIAKEKPPLYGRLVIMFDYTKFNTSTSIFEPFGHNGIHISLTMTISQLHCGQLT